MQALWMVLASLFFSVMSVCVKYAAVHFSNFELVFYRAFFSAFFSLFYLAIKYPGSVGAVY
jgi:S-adenosylmethionine uptake transporter